MIRGLLVDDEPLAREHLARLMADHPDCDVVGEASNGVEGLQLIADGNPDVVLLDIEMPGLSAADMLAQLRHPPLVVFTTAYDEFAVRAFDANAVDYLLKPIQAVRFAQAIGKIRLSITQPRQDYESSLRRVLSKLHPGPPTKLAGRRGKRVILLSPKDVLYIVVEDQIVFFCTQGERLATDRTISELDEFLKPAGFFRISRSAIVNLDHARELVPWFSGTWKLRLSNNVELSVSRDRARSLKSKVGCGHARK